MGQTIGMFLVAFVALAGAMLLWMPRYSRRELFFAVTVPAEFPASDAGLSIRRGYRLGVLVIAVIASAGAFWGARTGIFALPLVALPAEVAGCFLVFLQARHRALAFAVAPTPEREARLAPRHTRLPGGWAAQCAPLLLLVAAGVYLRAHWASIPARFPVHWGAAGQPNGWSERTAAGVYGPLLLGAGMSLAMLALGWLTLRWTRRVHASGSAAEADLARERRFLLVLLLAEYFMVMLLSWVALMPLRRSPALSPSPVVPLGMVIGLLLVLVLFFLLHRPIEPSPTPGAGPIGDRTEDRYWKAGVFYINPGDPALFVEKRFGIGYTMNLGHWASWVIAATIMLVPLLGALFAAMH